MVTWKKHLLMWLHMNHNVPRGCYLHFVKDGTSSKSLSVDQLHVANNIYHIVQEECKLDR